MGNSVVMIMYHSAELQNHSPFQVQNPSCPLMLHNHSSELIDNETAVLVVGGGGNCFSFGTAFNSYVVRIDLRQLR
jgi:tRNA wybutosine-synthesizing protein 4